MKKIKSILYKIKNAVRYQFKKDITKEELDNCNRLAHGGYVSWRTYGSVLQKEVETRIRNSRVI